MIAVISNVESISSATDLKEKHRIGNDQDVQQIVSVNPKFGDADYVSEAFEAEPSNCDGSEDEISESDDSEEEDISCTSTIIVDSPNGSSKSLDSVIRNINNALRITSPDKQGIDGEHHSKEGLWGIAASAHTTRQVDAIQQSLFVGGEDVLYFPKMGERVGSLPDRLGSALKWKISGFTPKVVRASLSRANFDLIRKGKKWIGIWGKHFTPERFKKVEPWQKVNHFPMSFEIGRKDKLLLNYQRLRNVFGSEEFGYLPETYVLPRQRRQLARVFDNHSLWIMKPPASARGKGIRLVTNFKSLSRKRALIVSRYIMRPYLIGGRKFDIRIYVLVTSFEPLRVYMYGDGVVRFASEKYTSSPKSANNRFIHLTNYSVSKRNKKLDRDDAERDGFLLGDPRFSKTASKWSFKTLQAYFAEQGVRFEPVYDQIKDIIIKTIISGHPSNASGVRLFSRSKSSCYELFGFDILLDSHLKPWLMEVNISPSLKASCDVDFHIKFNLVTDLFNCVGIRLSDMRLARESKDESRRAEKQPLPWNEKAKHKAFLHGKRTDYLSDMSAEDVRILQEAEDENHRRGAFMRLFPASDSERYLPFLHSLPYADRLLHHWTQHAANNWERVQRLRQITPVPPYRSLPQLSKPETPQTPQTCKPGRTSSTSSSSTSRSSSSLDTLFRKVREDRLCGIRTAPAALPRKGRDIFLSDSPLSSRTSSSERVSTSSSNMTLTLTRKPHTLSASSLSCPRNTPSRATRSVPSLTRASPAPTRSVRIQHLSLTVDDDDDINPGLGNSNPIFPEWPGRRGSLKTRMEKRVYIVGDGI